MNAQVLMEKVAEAAPRHYAFLIKTAAEVSESPFKEEILSDLDMLMKKAFQMPQWAGPAGKAMMGGAGAVAGAAAAGIAYALAGDMYDATKRGLLKSRHYRNMLDNNPDLKELPASDVQKAFSVLHRFNPEFASDPTVSGTWVRRQAQFGSDTLGDPKAMGELINSRKALTETKRLPQVPEVRGFGKKDQKGGFGDKDRRSLEDLHAAIGDIDGRISGMGQGQAP